jgi:hypothetical protein
MNGLTTCSIQDLTYKDLPDASPQQVFDYVVNHLFTQRTRASEGPICVMLDDKGNRCAVGSLIPVDTIKETVSRGEVTVGSGWNRWCYILGINPDPHWHLLRQLQTAHDSNMYADADLWLVKLYTLCIGISKQFDLNTCILETFRDGIFTGPYKNYLSSRGDLWCLR